MQLFGVAAITTGLALFALVLALVEQVVLQVLEENVQRGSRVYETGHVGPLTCTGVHARVSSISSTADHCRLPMASPCFFHTSHPSSSFKPNNFGARHLPMLGCLVLALLL